MDIKRSKEKKKRKMNEWIWKDKRKKKETLESEQVRTVSKVDSANGEQSLNKCWQANEERKNEKIINEHTQNDWHYRHLSRNK